MRKLGNQRIHFARIFCTFTTEEDLPLDLAPLAFFFAFYCCLFCGDLSLSVGSRVRTRGHKDFIKQQINLHGGTIQFTVMRQRSFGQPSCVILRLTSLTATWQEIYLDES